MKKLRWSQRLTLEEGIKAGKSNAQIAREIGVHRATVGREIARNADCRENYSARTADDLSWERQQEATPKRFLVNFNGVSYFQMLQKHDRIYTYFSRTHLNALPYRYEFNWLLRWDASYVRPGEHLRFALDSIYYNEVCLKSDHFSDLQILTKPSRAFSKRYAELFEIENVLFDEHLIEEKLLKAAPASLLSRERADVDKKYDARTLEKCRIRKSRKLRHA